VATAAGVFDVSQRGSPFPNADGESVFTAEETGESAWRHDDTEH